MGAVVEPLALGWRQGPKLIKNPSAYPGPSGRDTRMNGHTRVRRPAPDVGARIALPWCFRTILDVTPLRLLTSLEN